jgi:PTS system nitrogen regulatory IIA component
MKLDVREASRVLAVSESQIYRWVEAGEMPCSLMNHQPFFSRAELLEWATERRLPVSVELFETLEDEESGVHPLRLEDALARGGVHHGLRGADRQAVMRAVVERLPLSEQADREVVLDVFLAREALGSTGIGQGIAIPHVRSPLIFPGTPGSATLCFLETTVAFAAIDGLPVHTIFALVSPTVRGHLQLLSRLSMALLDPRFKAAVLRRATREEILAEAARVDAVLAETHASDGGGRSKG